MRGRAASGGTVVWEGKGSIHELGGGGMRRVVRSTQCKVERGRRTDGGRGPVSRGRMARKLQRQLQCHTVGAGAKGYGEGRLQSLDKA